MNTCQLSRQVFYLFPVNFFTDFQSKNAAITKIREKIPTRLGVNNAVIVESLKKSIKTFIVTGIETETAISIIRKILLNLLLRAD